MTKDSFDDFIAEFDLYSFDGLIKVTLIDGTSHEAVWITGLPPPGKAIDGRFEGLSDEFNVFYLINTKTFAVWEFKQIDNMVCLQQNYLV